ncbi:hypothetical protein [Vibrio alfacsensis]|uniref:hypothetical protein n=1 Tax=Vibrio alfacsensis TaxID=1074311 RepID=UPI004069019A
MTHNKTATEHRNELLQLGLECNGKVFTLPMQLSPVTISIADHKFAMKVGNNPRIAFPREATSNSVMREALTNLNLRGKRSLGITLEGWDFCDMRSSEKLYQTLTSIENEYRRLL